MCAAFDSLSTRLRGNNCSNPFGRATGSRMLDATAGGRVTGGRGEIVASNKRVVNSEKDHASRRNGRRSSSSSSSSNNSSSSTVALLIFLVLSLWRSPSSSTVDAFNGRAMRPTPNARRVGPSRISSKARDNPVPELRQPLPSRRPAGSCRVRPLVSAAATTAASSEADVANTAVGETEPLAATAPAKAKGSAKKKKQKKERLRVTTAAEMRELLSEEGGKTLFDLDARGDSQEMLEAREDEHPVIEAIRNRCKAGTKPGSHGDGLKVKGLPNRVKL